jgi:hypothetical protein
MLWVLGKKWPQIIRMAMHRRCFFFSLLFATNVLHSACSGGSGHAAGTTPYVPAQAPDPVPAQAPDPGSASGSPFVPSGSVDWPLFVYPQPGDPQVDVTQRVQWTAANDARAYQLQIGTTLGGNDVFDSGLITATSVAMPPLPAAVVLYARVRAVLNGWGDELPAGHWPRGSYTRFRTDDQTPASTFTNMPADNSLPAGAPLQWNANPLALGYRLILRGRYGAGILDSGVIHTPHVFITAPAGSNVFATLETIYMNRTVSSHLAFTAAGGTPSFTDNYDLAKELTAEVRSMADRDNQPYGTTALDVIANSAGSSTADCGQFMLALLQLIGEARVALDSRTLNVGIQDDADDAHTLVEVLDVTSNRWITLDPTFGLVTLRSDGVPATSAEISAAVRAQNWSALTFTFLTDAGELYARDYYIDYPLLFVNIQSASGSGLVQDPPSTLAPYFDSLPLPISGAASYSVKCAPGSNSATTDIDDTTETLDCIGPDGLTAVFLAHTIQPAIGINDTPEGWRLRRFRF